WNPAMARPSRNRRLATPNPAPGHSAWRALHDDDGSALDRVRAEDSIPPDPRLPHTFIGNGPAVALARIRKTAVSRVNGQSQGASGRSQNAPEASRSYLIHASIVPCHLPSRCVLGVRADDGRTLRARSLEGRRAVNSLAAGPVGQAQPPELPVPDRFVGALHQLRGWSNPVELIGHEPALREPRVWADQQSLEVLPDRHDRDLRPEIVGN